MPTGATLPDRAILPGFTDYYYNYNLQATSLSQVQFPTNVIMNGDGNGFGSGLASNYWMQRPPADGRERHLEGGNYSFADGHVKWFKASNVLAGEPSAVCGSSGTNTPNGSNATFCAY